MVGVYIKKAGAWKAASAISIKKAGAWKLATGIGIASAGAWKLGFGAITPVNPPANISLNKGTVSGSRVGNGSVTSESVTATAGGGTPAFIYAWTFVSGNAFTINSPAAATTTFTDPSAVGGTSRSGTFRVTATDSVGVTATIDVTVNLSAAVLPAITVNLGTGFNWGVQFVLGPFPNGANVDNRYTASNGYVTVSGGNGSYSYSIQENTSDTVNNCTITLNSSTGGMNIQYDYWSGGSFSVLNNIPIQYTVTVLDTEGTQGQVTFSVFRDSATQV